jgi:hypothetical protein
MLLFFIIKKNSNFNWILNWGVIRLTYFIKFSNTHLYTLWFWLFIHNNLLSLIKIVNISLKKVINFEENNKFLMIGDPYFNYFLVFCYYLSCESIFLGFIIVFIAKKGFFFFFFVHVETSFIILDFWRATHINYYNF